MSQINLKEATLRLNALAPTKDSQMSKQPTENGNGEQTTQTENAKQSKTKSNTTNG